MTFIPNYHSATRPRIIQFTLFALFSRRMWIYNVKADFVYTSGHDLIYDECDFQVKYLVAKAVNWINFSVQRFYSTNKNKSMSFVLK